MRTYTFCDRVITAEIILIGLAEAAHLGGVLSGWAFSRCVLLFWGMAGAALLLGAALFLMRRHKGSFFRERSFRILPGHQGERFLGIFFLLTVLSQLIFILIGDTVYVDRDMTAETVESFLVSDSLYQVNPVTGLPYQAGMPFRLEVLGLPTLYGSLCKAAGLSAATVVWRIVPVLVLISSYMAFGALGGCLFPGNVRKQLCFLTIVSLIMWAGAYLYGMDGFGLLCCGWRGVSIRNCVLVPWLFSLCLRKNWGSGLLCVLAEACITWTLYGCGVCMAVLTGMFLAGFCCRVYRRREHTG